MEKFNKIELYDLYINQNMSHREIAKIKNCTKDEITRILRKYKIRKKNHNRKFFIDNDELYDLYINKNKTRYELSKYYNCSEDTIKRYLKKYKIKKPKNLHQINARKGNEKNMKNFKYDDLYDLYINKNKSMGEISKILNSERHIISNYLEKFNIKKDYDKVVESRLNYINDYNNWSNIDNFKLWIKDKYNELGRKVTTGDVKKHFNTGSFICLRKLHELDETEYSKYYKIKSSYFESLVDDWLIKNNIKYKKHYRKFDWLRKIDSKYNMELDFYIEDKKIAIEINDTKHHNSSNSDGIDKFYHQIKTELCERNDVFLIHLFEKDLYDLDKFLGVLLVKEKIHAYHCTIERNFPSRFVGNFLDEYHRQGRGKSISENYCLFLNGIMVACMTFGKSRNKSKGDYELHRLCFHKDYLVMGGSQRMWKHFKEDNPDKSVISYCDRAYNTCKIYKNLGFEFSHYSEPNYKWVKGKEWLTRERCQRHKLSKKFNNSDYDDKNWTEKSIMENEGYVRVYDSGNSVWLFNG
jgi:hypothetical protein